MTRRFRIFAKRMMLKTARVTPGLRTEMRELDELRRQAARQSRYLPGHYYSTIPDWDSFQSRAGEDLKELHLRGIDLNEEKQLALVRSFADSLGSDFWT